MSKFKFTKPKVGDVVFKLEGGKTTKLEVVKVGRTYFYIDTHGAPEWSSGAKVRLDDWLEHGDYHNGRVVPSLDLLGAYLDAANKARDIKSILSGYQYQWGLSHDQIGRIHAILVEAK